MDKLCIVAFIYQKGGKFEGHAHFYLLLKITIFIVHGTDILRDIFYTVQSCVAFDCV